MQGELIKADRVGDALKIVALVQDMPLVLERVAKLAGKAINITITEPKEKRSLDANAYLWLIIGKIADKMRTSKEEVYLKLLKDYGQSFVITVKKGYDISKAGIKYYEVLKEGTFKGKEFTAYKVFIGSSQYDTQQMSILIDGAVHEAKELGIDVELTDYIDMMEGV